MVQLLIRVDPVCEAGHIGVHPGGVRAAAHAPGDEAHHRPPPGLGLADQGGAAVPCARVLADLAPGAHLAAVQLEPVPGARSLAVQRHLQVGVTPDKWELDES